MNKKEKSKVTENIINEIKAPKASHTKGFYRFSRFFPPAVNEEGFRDNEFKKKEPMSTKAKWLLAIGAVLVFCLSYVLISTAMMLSAKEPEQTSALHFEDEFYYETSADESQSAEETSDTTNETNEETQTNDSSEADSEDGTDAE